MVLVGEKKVDRSATRYGKKQHRVLGDVHGMTGKGFGRGYHVRAGRVPPLTFAGKNEGLPFRFFDRLQVFVVFSLVANTEQQRPRSKSALEKSPVEEEDEVFPSHSDSCGFYCRCFCDKFPSLSDDAKRTAVWRRPIGPTLRVLRGTCLISGARGCRHGV